MKNRDSKLWLGCVALVAVVSAAFASPAFAEEAAAATSSAGLLKPVGAGLAIGLAALGGGFGQGKAVAAMLDSFGRNPSVGGKLLAPLLIGLAFIESLVILAFVIAFSQIK